VAYEDDSEAGKLIRDALGAGGGDGADGADGGDGPAVVVCQIGRVFETHVQHAESRVDVKRGRVDELGEERREQLERRVGRVDARIAKVWDSLPTGALLAVLTCAGNTPLVSRLQRMRQGAMGKGLDGEAKFEWSMAMEELFDLENAEARRGMLLLRVKGPGAPAPGGAAPEG